MNKDQISAALIEAGLGKWIVWGCWQGSQCFVSFGDLSRLDAYKVDALRKAGNCCQTDKGLVFFAQEIA